MTSITAGRRAPTIIGQLQDQAQVTAKALSLAELTSESRVTSLLPEMDRYFGLHTVTLLHNNAPDFFDFSWDKSMWVEKFVIRFHRSLENLSDLDMNDELKGPLVIRQAHPDNHGRTLVVDAAAGEYSFQALAISLRKVFRTRRFPAASMNPNRPRYPR